VLGISAIGSLRSIFHWGRGPREGIAARWQGSYVLPSIAVALVGLALSVSAWTAVWLREDRLAEVELHDRTDNHALQLQYGINEDLKTLEALRALFLASDRTIGRREFETFSESLLRNQLAIQNLTWIPRVDGAERGTFELAAARDGIPGYHIKSVMANGLVRSEERDEYFPILYSSSASTESPIYGLDLNSEPMRRGTLERCSKNSNIATLCFPLRSTQPEAIPEGGA
jgi:CHASE1-domain containing sensor protein